MSFWKSKTVDVEAQNKLLQAKAARDAQISWVKRADREQITALFISLRDEMEAGAVTQNKTKDIEAHKTALQLFDQIQHYWFLVDRKLTNDDQTFALLDLLKVDLPEVVTCYRSRAIKHKARAALYEKFYPNDDYYADKTTLADEFNVLIEELFSMRNKVTVAGHIAAANSPVDRTKPFSLLNIPASDIDLWERVNKIIELHRVASEGGNSIEETYFLEESAYVYLPDALNLYANFKLASESVQVAARAALVEQLEIITSKLSEIVSHVMDYRLKDLQAQADFLRLKVDSGVTPAYEVTSGDSKVMAALSGGGK